MVKSFATRDVRGELIVPPQDGPIAAGSSVFAQIKLSTLAEGRQHISADLLIEAEHGEIGAVTGATGEVQDDGQLVRATIDGLRKGRDRILQVEVKLPRARSGRTGLKVTLSSNDPARAYTLASFEEASAEIVWYAKDCAGSYASALRQIRDNAQWRPMERWREASMADASLPRSWLFTTKDSRPNAGFAEPQTTGSSSTRNERQIFSEADKLVRARKDPALDREGTLGWTLGKLADDLESYLSQPGSPAICTGVAGLLNYYQSRLDGLKSARQAA